MNDTIMQSTNSLKDKKNPEKLSFVKNSTKLNKKNQKKFKNNKRKFGKELQNHKSKKFYVKKYKEHISTASSLDEKEESKLQNLSDSIDSKIEIKSKINPKNLSTSNLIQKKPSKNFFSKESIVEQNEYKPKESLSKISEIFSEKRNLIVKRECPQQVKQYEEKIKKYLVSKDSENILEKNFISSQKEINYKMRAKLVDWIIDVSLKFKLLDQTLFASIWYLDQYISKSKEISKNNLQLIGICCLMISAKFEEVYPPCLSDYEKVCDGAYSIDEIIDFEGEIMVTLNFNLAFNSSLLFYQKNAKELSIKGKPYFYGEFLLTNGLLDETINNYSQNILSEAVCFLLNKMFKLKLKFDDKKEISQIKTAAKNIYKFLKKTEKLELTATKRKFGKSEKMEVSKFKVERVNKTK